MSEELKEMRKSVLIEYKGTYVFDQAEVKDLLSFKCRDDDVWVCSFPRSGTTLTQQLTYLIMTLDFEKATTVDLDDRFPMAADICDDAYPYFRGLKYLDSLPTTEPRMMKNHIHYFLCPEELKKGKGKIIYITRNPKSCVTSLFNLFTYFKDPPAPTLQEYVERFLTQKNVYMCPWGLHVRQFWEKRNDPNVLFLQFENLIQDRRGAIKKIADFLGKDLTDEQIEKVMEHTSLEAMKTNRSVNHRYIEEMFMTDKTDGAFINKGEVSGWKRDLSDELIAKMDELIKNELKDTDIVYE